MRRSQLLLASAASLTVLAALTACSSGSPSPASTTTAAAAGDVDVCATPSGSASKSVTVTQDVATTPTATFDNGISVKKTERTVVVKGTGKELKAGGTATVAYAVYNGSTGKQIDASGYDGTTQPQFTASASALMTGLAKTIGCVNEGSRVVSVIPPADAFGKDGNTQLGIGAKDNLVVVLDVKKILPDKAWGAEQPAPEGLPAVKLAKDGKPTITLPKTDAPTEFKVGVLKKGNGAVVAEGATVTVQYQGTSWDTGKIFDQSWGRGTAQFSLAQVVPGFSKAIAGQTVGSQVIAVLPPVDAYGEKSDSNTSELAGQTLVFVIDILAAS
ncbi:FKBP-type peptidyl-prolyl cis-trans isomerase [Rathayibacter sp. YIM 133350]|uniref:FKBP-type peptidyl-prolyl cis-trans isomerase n=1 Tax=Rathayibacter sp. YIM 133350 TaxID=3131992 RepID=UPI00307DC73A